MSGAGSSNHHTSSNSTFEFTKRKRWADILITGITDVLILILSPRGKVLYCGTTVTELLGWNETDVLDLHLNDFIVGEDQPGFQRGFDDSIHTNTEFISYVRFKNSPLLRPAPVPPNDVIFEIKGYPHFVTEQGPECKCFFAIARPYPSRNIAMLNTLLGLQAENERLQQRLAILKSQVNSQITPVGQTLPDMSSMYATSSLQHGQYSSLLDDVLKNTSAANYDSSLVGTNYSGDTQGSDDLEDSSRRKKLKKTQGIEQYVCRKCGRTDSPEWRKGPDGPKTLCNACGLRWAKQMRKFDEPAEETGSNSSGPSSTPGTDKSV